MARSASDNPKDKLTLSLDKDLKRRFSLVCKWREIEMSQVASKLFDEWLEENTPPGLFDLPKEEPPSKGENANGKKGGKSPVS